MHKYGTYLSTPNAEKSFIIDMLPSNKDVCRKRLKCITTTGGKFSTTVRRAAI